MKKTTNTNTTTSNTALKGMIPGLKMMHSMCNTRAISADFAAGCGIPANMFGDWKNLIEKRLYQVALAYAEHYHDKAISDDQLAAFGVQIDAVWSELTQIASETGYPLFKRIQDVDRIGSFATAPTWSINGTVEGAVAPKEFRRKVETMLGLRMAQNAVLSAKDTELMTKYDQALVKLTKANESLNGTERNGKEIPGAVDKLAEAKEKLAEMTKAAIALGVPEKQVNDHPLIAGYVSAVSDAEKKIKNLKKQIEELQDYLRDNKVKYNAITAKISKIK